jgi:hypothetical protein
MLKSRSVRRDQRRVLTPETAAEALQVSPRSSRYDPARDCRRHSRLRYVAIADCSIMAPPSRGLDTLTNPGEVHLPGDVSEGNQQAQERCDKEAQKRRH